MSPLTHQQRLLLARVAERQYEERLAHERLVRALREAIDAGVAPNTVAHQIMATRRQREGSVDEATAIARLAAEADR